jgi:hypothetical protein
MKALLQSVQNVIPLYTNDEKVLKQLLINTF